MLYLSCNIYPENGCLTLEDPTQSSVISKREFPFPSKVHQFCFNCCSLIWIVMLFLERNTCLTPMLTLYYLSWQITCLLIVLLSDECALFLVECVGHYSNEMLMYLFISKKFSFHLHIFVSTALRYFAPFNTFGHKAEWWEMWSFPHLNKEKHAWSYSILTVCPQKHTDSPQGPSGYCAYLDKGEMFKVAKKRILKILMCQHTRV